MEFPILGRLFLELREHLARRPQQKDPPPSAGSDWAEPHPGHDGDPLVYMSFSQCWDSRAIVRLDLGFYIGI